MSWVDFICKRQQSGKKLILALVYALFCEVSPIATRCPPVPGGVVCVYSGWYGRRSDHGASVSCPAVAATGEKLLGKGLHALVDP